MLLIVQCRVNSTRLPKKALLKIQKKTILEHMILRLKKCKNIDKLLICTSINTENDAIVDICNKTDVDCFRGSEKNVLDRFYKASVKYNADNIIRCTADCPLIDHNLVDDLITEFKLKKYKHLNFRNKDITRNNQFPDGFDAEIFSFEVLKEAWLNDKSDFGKEHVTPYIVKKYGKNYYKIPNIEKYTKIDFANFHLSIDTIYDFEKVKYIYDNLYPNNKDFGLYDVLLFLHNIR